MALNWYQNLKNLVMTEEISKNLKRYYELIIEYNKKFNLTRIIEKEEVYIKHFYDALLISNEINLNDQNICDVGTGMGVPGIVLKICFPELKLTLIESNQKKCDFLKTVVSELKLENVYIVNQRAENFSHQYREIFDIVVARAVASLDVLVEVCLPLVKIDGIFVAYKGLNADKELSTVTKSLEILGAKLKLNANYDLPNNFGSRSLLLFSKFKLTALKYPRSYQQIKKQPL